jgi:transcriptional repressor NrdR
MKTKVTNSRTQIKSPIIWRRRICLKCHRVFSSYERPSTDSLKVTSKNGTKMPFSIGKLTLSIAKSFSHNTQAAEFDSMSLAQTVELQLLSLTANPLTNNEIADHTYQTLKRYDELAAVQYAAKHQLITTVRRRGRPSITSSYDQTL